MPLNKCRFCLTSSNIDFMKRRSSRSAAEESARIGVARLGRVHCFKFRIFALCLEIFKELYSCSSSGDAKVI